MNPLESPESMAEQVPSRKGIDENPPDGNPPNWFVARTHPVRLPRFGPLKRNSPRRIALQQGDYRERHDDSTLFYDSFSTPEGIRLIGPPLLNLAVDLAKAEVTDGRGRPLDLELNELNRLHSAVVRDSATDFIRLRSETINVGFQPQTDHLATFEGRRVMLTKSKGNRLEWIRDWARFHVIHHGIDAVLIYDNDSSEYDCEDILHCLEGITGLQTAVVVDWPFMFGPRGGDLEGIGKAPWDSDYCQYGALEHARRRFLDRASLVINQDIDELLITDSESTVCDLVDSSPNGLVSYGGRWIETVTSTAAEVPRFADYLHFDETRDIETTKWAIDPQRTSHAKQWRVHDVVGIDTAKPGGILHRHFMGINFNWKLDRTAAVAFDPRRHVLDQALKDALDALESSTDPQPEFVLPLSILERLKADLVFSDAGVEPKLWFFRDDCLVVDFSSGDLNVGFDVATKNDLIDITVVARGAASIARLEHVYEGMDGVGFTAPNRWSIASVAPDTPASVITWIIETQAEFIFH